MSKELEPSFKETILKSDLPSIIESAGELGIDSLLDDGLLKDIPILNYIHAIGKTASNVKDYIFTRKMFYFLQSLSSMDDKERKKLISKLYLDDNFGAYAGERIIELLTRLDGEKKPILLAVALRMYAQEEITSSQLVRINYSIERFLLCDLGELREFCSVNAETKVTDDNPVTINFINSGLAYVKSGYGVGGVHPTETAEILLKVADEAHI